MLARPSAVRLFSIPPLPPGYEGQPWLYLFSMFAQMGMALLVMEWAWRLAWSLYERPAPLKSPVTSSRLIVLALLFSVSMRGLPDVIYNMRWADLSPAGRHAMLSIDETMDGLALVPFLAAYVLDRMASGMMTFQLQRDPIPLHLWPTWAQLRRPVKMGMGVFVLAFALTFLR